MNSREYNGLKPQHGHHVKIMTVRPTKSFWPTLLNDTTFILKQKRNAQDILDYGENDEHVYLL